MLEVTEGGHANGVRSRHSPRPRISPNVLQRTDWRTTEGARLAADPGRGSRFGKELLFIAGLGLVGFLGVSLVSLEVSTSGNAAGIAGAATARWLVMVLGRAAFLLPCFLLYNLAWMLRPPPRGLGWGVLAAQVVFLLGAAAALALARPAEVHAGGQLGHLIKHLVGRYFGELGSAVVLGFLLTASGVRGTGLSLTLLIPKVARLLVSAARCGGLGALRLVAAAARLLLWAAWGIGKGLKLLGLEMARGLRGLRLPKVDHFFEYQPLLRPEPLAATLDAPRPACEPWDEVDELAVRDPPRSPAALLPRPDDTALLLPEEQEPREDAAPTPAYPALQGGQAAAPPRIVAERRPAPGEVFEVQPTPPHHLQGYQLPPLSLLDDPPPPESAAKREELIANSQRLEEKLRDYGIEGRVVQVLPGPVVTMYEYEPASGVKVNRIASLSDDLALAMKAYSVRIVAPVPGKAVVGIEIPNRRREAVVLKDIIADRQYRDAEGLLNIALGKDMLGHPAWTDLARIPHLLIAGATGSGKSVAMNSIICSILFRATPQDVKLLLIDPKMLEFTLYDGLPHLLAPVVTHPKKAAVALKWVVEEMERRYRLLSERGVRNIARYNLLVEREHHDPRAPAGEREAAAADAPNLLAADAEELVTTTPAGKLPYIVVLIDELADLMIVSSREVEESLARLAQMARASGVHLLVATQRPSVDVLTGLIKANFPARISFQVSSRTDSRTILDGNGAERLLGQGDMLFLPPGTSSLKRIHGAYVSEEEIKRLVSFWREQQQPEYRDLVVSAAQEGDATDEEGYDEKYDEAVALVARTGQASISMLQRRLRVGYNRAARMIEMMERDGLVGPADGSKPRDVYARPDYDEE